MRLRLATIALTSLVSLPPLTAAATPGPATTVVVGNSNVPESVALARQYAAARDLPPGQVCLLDVEDVEDIDLASYRADFLEPLRACLDATPGTLERIEAAVIVRGLPLRVRIPVADATQVVSLAAALMLWETTRAGSAVLGENPGATVDCGRPCYGPAWRNPYRRSAFESGWSAEVGEITWRPLLVTMLHGRTYEDAARLLDSALAAEAMDPALGEMLFMDGRDSARGVLDVQYDRVIADLRGLGFTAERVPFDPDLAGRTLSSFVTGTATLGATIEGNTFLPGTLVDNLTSFGAGPVNFRETGESQVSIARWVALGVAGVHGTVAEPLNRAFPDRTFLVRYVLGATLAEAYHSSLPNAYWRNLVLGDAIAAPHARRPTVELTGVADGSRIAGAETIRVTATDIVPDRGVASVTAYLDGVQVAMSTGDTLEHCLVAPAGDEQQLLIVARAGEDPAGDRIFRPKGWLAITLSSDGVSTDCAEPQPDGGLADGGVAEGGIAVADGGLDAGADGPSGEGCGCRVFGARPGGMPAAFFMAAVLLARRRRSAARSARGRRSAATTPRAG
ncbi:MAG TPA: TIGR03790 family protein [Polyangiaceae bacterium]|nr:TIGR03790 family protein [Polyangiaceae bacterium]